MAPMHGKTAPQSPLTGYATNIVIVPASYRVGLPHQGEFVVAARRRRAGSAACAVVFVTAQNERALGVARPPLLHASAEEVRVGEVEDSAQWTPSSSTMGCSSNAET